MTRDGIWPDQEVLQGATQAAGRHAVDADASGRIATEAIVTLTEAGFPGCFVPTRWGGAAATFDAVTKAVATVGEGCPSAAWISSLWAYNGRFGAYLPPEGQEEVWAKGPDTRIVSSMIAVGAEAQPCPDGWMLSGSWLYVSGVEFADWALISSGLPREGDRHIRVLAVPKEAFTHDNTWSTIGMRATGSHTMVVERAFVPEYRSFIWDDMRQGMLPGATSTAHSAPLFAVNGLTFAAPILGAARGALRLAEQHLAAGPSGPRAAARESSLIAYARAAGEIDAAALLLSRVADTADRGRYRDGQAERNHRDSTLAVSLLTEAVDRLFGVTGTRGQASTHAMQRIWRDVHTAASHAALQFEPAAIGYARRRLSG
jgi:two-component flavin-dependent monooxygenase